MAKKLTSAFFRRYSMIMGLAYGALVVVAFGLFAFQLDQREEAEIELLSDRLREHALVVDTLAMITSMYVNVLADEIEQDLAQRAEGRSASFGAIGPTFSGRFDPTESDEVWVSRVLRNQGYQIAQLQAVERSFFISERDFSLVYPPSPSVDGLLDRPPAAIQFFRYEGDGIFWSTEPDDFGRLRTICARPVFTTTPAGERERVGVVGVELAFPYLNRVNGDLNYEVGHTSLIDHKGYGVVLGAGATLAAAWNVIEVLPPREVGSLDEGEVGYQHPLSYSPWTMVYRGARMEILWPLIRDLGQQGLLLLATLTLMVLIASRLTRHEFIDPASKLVDHIANAGRGEQDHVPRVPPTWAPWFTEVTRIFSENADFAAFKQELDVAANMQSSILPKEFESPLPVEVHGRMAPARVVGGDFYDYFELDDGKIGICVADVAGKGMPAALFMMISRTLLHSTAITGISPGACLERVNRLLCPENHAYLFVTVFYGIFDVRSGELVFANGGHNLPFILRRDDAEALPQIEGLPLGLIEDAEYAEASVPITSGEGIFLYSDGITEAFNPAEEEYGEERLEEALERHLGLPAAELIQRVVADVEAFAGEADQADDMTVVVLRNLSPAGTLTESVDVDRPLAAE